VGKLKLKSKHRLLCGDSTSEDDVARLMDGNKADLCFTDPPYNVGYKYETYDDKRSDYPEWCNEWIQKIGSVCAKDCWVYVKTIPRNLAHTLASLDQIGRFANLVVWSRGSPAIPSNRFCDSWESICIYKMGEPVFNKKAQVKDGVIADERGGGINKSGRIGEIWDDIKPVTAGSRCSKEAILKKGTKSKSHSAQMPLSLPKRAMVFCTNEKHMILDLFLGSGTTLIACEQLNRQCYGMEIDPLYCDVVVKRWENLTGEKAVCNG